MLRFAPVWFRAGSGAPRCPVAEPSRGAMPKLTKRVVDALRPSAAGETFVWDSDLKGFGVRMMPTGVGSYVPKYRNKE